MGLLRALALLAAPLVFGSCGYVHFGRMPASHALGSDAAMAERYSNLALEYKILKQELALARREGDALRVALEQATAGALGADGIARLNETALELATLRAAYAKAQIEQPLPNRGSGASPLGQEPKEKLGAQSRDYSQLQEENVRLQADLQRARDENSSLSERLSNMAAQNEQAQAALSQLNFELLAQKQARARAEQSAIAPRAQLVAVVAAGPSGASSGAPMTAKGVGALRLAKAPPAGASATAELRTSPERLGETAAASAATEVPRHTHIVQPGDTLAMLALQYYGATADWPRIRDANAALASGEPLAVGMELLIPAR